MDVLKLVYGDEYSDIPEKDSEAKEFLLANGETVETISEKIKNSRVRLEYLTEDKVTVTSDRLKKLNRDILYSKRIVPVSINEGTVYFAIDSMITRPLRDLADEYAKAMNMMYAEIKYFVFTDEFKNIIDVVFSDGENGSASSTNSRRDLANSIESGNAQLYADAILDRGFELRASDIHIESLKEGLQVRYRVDGQLIVKDFYAESEIGSKALINVIKVRSGLKIEERRKGQDGRIQDIEYKGNRFDVRTSSIATVIGEKLVLRILDKTSNIPSLKELGFSKFYVESILNDVQKSHGLVLYTGSVGSGKSTTQRTLLVNSNPDIKNVYSIEDPVERTIPFVNHVCVKETNTGFEEHLETLLRQDPDVIAIGEIRNKKTMDMALKASLSGQLVFATLHTNSAIEAFYRLFNMGVEPYELGAALIGISSQRLIRNLCPYCSNKRKTTDAEKALIAGLLSRYSKFSTESTTKFDYISDPKGCSHCNQTGYYGRTVVGEYLSASDQIKHYVSTGDVDRDELLEMAHKSFVPIEVDALNKVLLGKTSLSEVLRVI